MKRLLIIAAMSVIACLNAAAQPVSQQIPSSENVKTFNGRLVDDATNKRIAYATVWMRGTDISVVSNGDVEKFPTKERLRTNDLVFDKIIDYDDLEFWEGYNPNKPLKMQ